MKRSDLTSSITAPKFKVGRYSLNEYEAREMIARIAEGTLSPEGIVLIDEDGKKFTFDNDGLTQQAYRIKHWDIGSSMSIRKIKANRLNPNSNYNKIKRKFNEKK